MSAENQSSALKRISNLINREYGSQLEEQNIPQEEERELTPEERLEQSKKVLWSATSDKIRQAAKNGKFVRLSELCTEFELDREVMLAVIAEMKAQEGYDDLYCYEGTKEIYYYVYPKIAHNYVRNCALAESDDIERIVAEVVRYESKTYPRPTCTEAFGRFPYRYTSHQVKVALERMLPNAEYADLKTYTSKVQQKLYIYSTQYLDVKRAEFLADDSEDFRSKL